VADKPADDREKRKERTMDSRYFQQGARPAVRAPLLTACAQTTPPPASDTTRIEQRLNDIERRVELLESRPQVQAPLRTREDILEHRERPDRGAGQADDQDDRSASRDPGHRPAIAHPRPATEIHRALNPALMMGQA
jgi:hypothetical protein